MTTTNLNMESELAAESVSQVSGLATCVQPTRLSGSRPISDGSGGRRTPWVKLLLTTFACVLYTNLYQLFLKYFRTLQRCHLVLQTPFFCGHDGSSVNVTHLRDKNPGGLG